MVNHLSHPPPEWEFIPPADLLDPDQVPKLVKDLVEKLSLRGPETRATLSQARVCTGCGVAFEGAYRECICSNCWFAAWAGVREDR